ncbi:MAG TPA: cysteine--tRNA ligase [Candidatus Saccharimonadales bacterium]|nr:cysteine--tRNA ligase [Candidatus Saccharimonadales bacterium]
MKLYNTLTKKVEEINPIAPPAVTIYTCGPTVYDYPHVGNWYTFIRYDLLVRALKIDGLEPKWVMNITDVGHLVSDADEGEDKLEKGARREGKTAWDVAKFYGDYFTEGLKRLNFVQPTYLPKATEHIQEQIDLVKTLEEKGYTYKIDDGIYYDTSKFPKYSDFAQLDIDEQQAGKRVSFNEQKRNTSDFALWKFSPRDHQRDMEWDSPWGKGFPGWHLECSAMSRKYLGDTIDIHSGGIDHVPVHHTNEIAQSEAATGQQFAHYWMHTNHILVDDEKISKSLGNGITLEDIENKGYSLEAFRLHVYESHYRSQSKFNWESLEAAQNRLNDLHAAVDLRHQTNVNVMPDDLDQMFKSTREGIHKAILDDLDTPKALSVLSQFVTHMLSLTEIPGAEGKYSDGTLAFFDDVFGLNLANRPDITDDQKQLIADREKARSEKDWQRADELRNALEEQGIGLRDTPRGAIWYRL